MRLGCARGCEGGSAREWKRFTLPARRLYCSSEGYKAQEVSIMRFSVAVSLNSLDLTYVGCQLMFKMIVIGVLVACCMPAAVESFHIPTPTVSIIRDAGSASQNTAATITSFQSAGSDGYFTTTKHITIEGVTNDHVTIAGKTIDIAIPTCIQTITPDANGYVPPGTCGAIWDYYPNFPAALVFACIFGILTMIHVWQAIANRKVRIVNHFSLQT